MPRIFRAGNLVSGLAMTLLLANIFTFNCYAAHDGSARDDSTYQTGKKIFSHYCSRCHGEHADGRGKALPLYVSMREAHPSNFQHKFYAFRTKEYLANIVRDGGKQHSLSEFMPPFGAELSKQQINDVVYFIQNVSLHISSPYAKDELAQAEKAK